MQEKTFNNWWMWKLQNKNEYDTVFYESKCTISAMHTWVAGFLVTPPQGDQVTWSVLKSSALLGLRNGTGSARMWVRSGWVWGACLTWPSTGTTYRGSTNISRRYAVKRHNHDLGWHCRNPRLIMLRSPLLHVRAKKRCSRLDLTDVLLIRII